MPSINEITKLTALLEQLPKDIAFSSIQTIEERFQGQEPPWRIAEETFLGI